MNSRKNLRNISLLFVFSVCLILIGYLIYISKKTEVIKIIASPAPISSGQVSYAKVTRVIDGDTIVIDTGQHIRYIGMNTPEIETNDCFATQAAEINKTLVLGKTVKLEKDVSETDKYGRLLRYVYIDGGPSTNSGQIPLFINNYLVKFGSARVETVPPDVKYKNGFSSSEKYARENKLGLWSICFGR